MKHHAFSARSDIKITCSLVGLAIAAAFPSSAIVVTMEEVNPPDRVVFTIQDFELDPDDVQIGLEPGTHVRAFRISPDIVRVGVMWDDPAFCGEPWFDCTFLDAFDVLAPYGPDSVTGFGPQVEAVERGLRITYHNAPRDLPDSGGAAGWLAAACAGLAWVGRSSVRRTRKRPTSKG
jgi:hypothetical protein